MQVQAPAINPVTTLDQNLQSGSARPDFDIDDAEPFVTRLRADLTARGFDVWWDRVSRPARGLTFLHEIRNAIDARERFLLVLGPKAMTTPRQKTERILCQ